MSATWSNGLCGCCSIKDCGAMCCLNTYFCFPCVWGSAMEAAGVGSCLVCCLGIACEWTTICTVCYGGQEVAKKYSIEEGMVGGCLKACCCPCCYAFQIMHEIMVKESLHFSCMSLVKDGGAPTITEMER